MTITWKYWLFWPITSKNLPISSHPPYPLDLMTSFNILPTNLAINLSKCGSKNSLSKLLFILKGKLGSNQDIKMLLISNKNTCMLDECFCNRILGFCRIRKTAFDEKSYSTWWSSFVDREVMRVDRVWRFCSIEWIGVEWIGVEWVGHGHID